MRGFVKMLCGLSGSVIIYAIVAGAFPVPAMNVADLAERANLVVIGRVISVTQKGTKTINVSGQAILVRVMIGEMRVDQILKGTVDVPQLSFEFDMPDVPIGYQGVVPMSYQMVFLKKAEAGYSFVSHNYPSVGAIPGVPLRGTGVLENVCYQLEAVVKDSGTDSSQKQEALWALGTMQVPAATAALKSALQERSTDVQLSATAALLDRNDISGIQIAEAALTNRPSVVPSYLFHNIAYAISHGVRDERAIPALTRLLRLSEVETRRASASALWHTHSDSAATALASALNDQDFEVRFYGVIGLAEITGQSDWHPNMEAFHEDEIKYLQHWREWVRTNHPLQR